MNNLLYILLLLTIGTCELQSQTYLDSVSLSVKSLPDSTKVKRFIKAFGHLIYNDLEQAKLATDSSYKYAIQSKVKVQIGRSIENKGSYYFLQNKLDTALSIYTEAYDFYSSYNDRFHVAGVLINLANTYDEKGDYLMAQKLHLRSLAIQDSLGVTGYSKATNLFNLAEIYSDLESFKEGFLYYEEARKIYNSLKDDFAVAEVDYNLATNLLELDSLESAEDIYYRLETYHRENGHIYYLQDVLMKQAEISYIKGDLNRSESILLGCLKTAEKTKDESIYQYLFNKLMELYARKGDLDKAEKYAIKSYEYIKENGNISDLVVDLKNLSDIYRDKASYQKAYEYHLRFHHLQDSLFSVDKMNESESLKQKYESDRKDAEITMLNQKVKINGLYKVIFGIGLIASIMTIFFAIFWYKQKEKNEQRKRDAKERELEAALIYKRKELASQTLHLVQKNTFLQNITERIEKLKHSADTHSIEIQKVLTSLKLEPQLDKDWKSFKAYFQEVHNDFDKKLEVYNSSISDHEMRLAYLIRMQLTGSEIATVMHVLPESVRKSKYRLKKKLSLSKDQDLAKFLKEL